MLSRIVQGTALAAGIALAGMPALAADTYKPGAYEPAPSYDEPPPVETSSGWYIGGLLGYGLGDIDINGGGFNVEPDGAIAGGIVGWNFINSGFLFGVEGDILGGSLEDSQAFGANTVDASVDWMAGLRARAGFFITPDILLFGTIGAGWADIDLPTTGAGGGSGSEVFSGIQYGAGTELALSDRWSLRMDYLYTDLDSETITYSGGNTTTYDPDIHQFRAGLQLKF